MTRKKKKDRIPKPPELVTLEIESIDLEGQGVAHANGKVHFVEGAITGEKVVAEIIKAKPSYAKAKTVEIIRAAGVRVKPKCPSFGVCGGCAMQHIEADTQVAIKSRALEDLLQHIGRVRPEVVLQPIYGPSWGYRHRARLTARFVEKKGGMLVGFHERGSSYVVKMSECHILPRSISDLLEPMARMLEGLSIFTRVPQVELAIGQGLQVLVLRHLEPLSESDRSCLSAFAQQYGVQWWLQPAGPETAHPLDGEETEPLYYLISNFGVRMHFKPTDFTQVNHMINDTLISRAVSLLGLKSDDRVLDLFCGLGNFTLPLATRCSQVKAFEGSADLVKRGQENAVLNGLQDRCEFNERNLFEVTPAEWQSWGRFNKVLIDPPRDGALEICKSIAQAAPEFQPERIVYVSCNPATLARDAGVLCNTGPYVLKAAGVVNMFPHTAHVESIAVFEKVSQTQG